VQNAVKPDGVDGNPRNNVILKGRHIVGHATMLGDSRIRVDLELWTKSGEIASTETYSSDHPWYNFILKDVGGLKTGESKSLYAPYPHKDWPPLPQTNGERRKPIDASPGASN